MERLPLSTNKSNLLRLAEELGFARDGLELLDEKKEALIPHILSLASKAEQVRTRMNTALDDAYRHLREAVRSQGRPACERASWAPRLPSVLQIQEKSFMGVALPLVRLLLPDHLPPYGFQGTAAPMDAVALSIRQALELIVELAEIEIALLRLETEIKKTIKRINALESIYIPIYVATIKHIEESLEEKEREFLFQLKRQKRRREEAGHEPV